MSQESLNFLNRMLEFLPETLPKYHKTIEDFGGEILETIIIEDVILPILIEKIRLETDSELLQRVFKYFEEVTFTTDVDLINNFTVTILEVLGNEKEILTKAEMYMGSNTRRLQIEADLELGRDVKKRL